jgi:hypothetical protein
MQGMTYRQTLKNLNTLERHIPFDEKLREALALRVCDYGVIAEAKVAPHEIFNAYKHYSGRQQLIIDALAGALDHAADLAPKIAEPTIVAVDTSGSMTFHPIARGKIMCAEAAGFFGAALKRSNPDTVTLSVFATSLAVLRAPSDSHTVDLLEAVKNKSVGGGTRMSLPYMQAENERPANLIIISDEEGWRMDSNCAKLARSVAKNTRIILWNLCPSRGTMVQVKSDKILRLAGFSATAFKLVDLFLNDNLNLNYFGLDV